MVEQGEITWDDEEEFEVEQILDHVVEEEVSRDLEMTFGYFRRFES